MNHGQNDAPARIDRRALQAYFVRRGYTQDDVRKLIGMGSNATMTRRMATGDFKLSECRRLIDVLGIENPADIFFPQN